MPVTLDPVATEQTFAINRSKSEVVTYYRAPEVFPHPKHPNGLPNTQAGWITWGDTQPAKRLAMMQRGFQPVAVNGEFIRIWDNDPNFQKYGPWGPILRHPDGPALFPVEQILTYRWYKRNECPVPFPGKTAASLFPQLAQWAREGNKLTEYNCPECRARSFHEPWHLGRHLQVSHNYDRANLIALGEEMGISFLKVPGGQVQEEFALDADEAPAPPPELPEDTFSAVTPERKRRSAA